MSGLIIKSSCLLSPLIHYRQETVWSLNEAENNKYTLNKIHARVASFMLSIGTQNAARAYKIFVNKTSGFLQKNLVTRVIRKRNQSASCSVGCKL